MLLVVGVRLQRAIEKANPHRVPSAFPSCCDGSALAAGAHAALEPIALVTQKGTVSPPRSHAPELYIMYPLFWPLFGECLHCLARPP